MFVIKINKKDLQKLNPKNVFEQIAKSFMSSNDGRYETKKEEDVHNLRKWLDNLDIKYNKFSIANIITEAGREKYNPDGKNEYSPPSEKPPRWDQRIKHKIKDDPLEKNDSDKGL